MKVNKLNRSHDGKLARVRVNNVGIKGTLELFNGREWWLDNGNGSSMYLDSHVTVSILS